MRKIHVLFVFVISSFNLIAQEGFNTGAQINTSFQLNSHRGKATKIWSSESGYGFTAGVPFRYGYAEDRAFCSGIAYEYMAFDNWAGNTLVLSTRLHSIHVPATIHFNVISNIFISAGTGMNLLFRSRRFQPGNNVPLTTINPIQPYLSLGVGSIAERGSGLFELSMQARYHFLDMWKKTDPLYSATSSKIVSLDLVLRFYF